MFPGWLNKNVTAALDPNAVLVPVPFWSADVVKKVDMVTGVAVFLQWDYMCSSAAIVIWAAALYSEVSARASRNTIELAGQCLLIGVLAGPGAVAAFLIQEREAVLQSGEALEKKIQ